MIQVGDLVQYKAEFLRSIQCFTGNICFAKGKVKGVKDYGGLQVATVVWDLDDVPEKVRTSALKKVGEYEPA